MLYGDIEQHSYEYVVQTQKTMNWTFEHIYFRNYSKYTLCTKSSIIIKT